MINLIATYATESRVKYNFPNRESAIRFGRSKWSAMKRAGVKTIAVVDTCGEVEVVWADPAAILNAPEGYYGCNGKRYHLSRPTAGRWADWTFISTGSDYHDRKNLATVRPDGFAVKSHPVMFAIAADPFQRAAEYGQITGKCSVCNRKLEDPVSRSIGMGPICRQRFGV